MNSMTGFGRGVAEHDGREAAVEIKTVNSRYLDISFRMPRVLNPMEGRIRQSICAAISRGKVDVSVSYRNRREDHADVMVDMALAKSYQRAMETLREHTGLHYDLTLTELASYPLVLSAQESEEDEEAVWLVIQQALDLALGKLAGMRQREGERLREDLMQKVQSVRQQVEQVQTHAPAMEQAARDRLMDKMKEYYEADETLRQRVLAEAAMLADKRAIDEEIVRLFSHLEEFLYNLGVQEPIGRKLDFIVQEMNRETNTIGSKASERSVNALVINIKSEIEKIREQIQNIE